MDDRRGALALKIEEESDPDRRAERNAGVEDAPGGPPARQESLREYDLPAQFFHRVGATTMLTREEELELARDLVRARNRIRRLLRRFPRLTAAALPSHGRNVVRPAHDFREHETVTILNFARRQLQSRRRTDLRFGTRLRLREFVKTLDRELKAYRKLRDRMIEANLRLVISFARRYRRSGVSFLDMVQEGTLGLIRAVEKYDPVKEVKFGTYAVWWVWQQIGRAGDVHGGLIRTPVHWNQLRRKVGRERQRLQTRTGGTVDRTALAAASGVDADQLDTMTQEFQCLSLDSPLGSDDDRTLEELIASEGDDPERQAAAVDLSEQLEVALAQLPQREADILRLRFGTVDSRSLTLEEVGQRYGVSRERIRQLEARALKQLLPICEGQGLRAYVG
ncbi:MAG: RNA polymerase sigma factor RpoD/SigA [Candidatus Binatia bacterium]